MGKKKTEQDEVATPNTGAVANKDLMQRMNFLYQVASHLSQQPSLPQEIKTTSPKRRSGGKRKGSLQDLAAFHVRTMRTIGNKTMVKMDPSVKRTLCKGCHTVVIPGHHVRIKASRSHCFVKSQTCHNCGWTRRLPCPPQPREGNKVREEEEISCAQSIDLSRDEQRTVRPAPLFEQEGHVVYISNSTGKNIKVSQGKDTAGVLTGGT